MTGLLCDTFSRYCVRVVCEFMVSALYVFCTYYIPFFFWFQGGGRRGGWGVCVCVCTRRDIHIIIPLVWACIWLLLLVLGLVLQPRTPSIPSSPTMFILLPTFAPRWNYNGGSRTKVVTSSTRGASYRKSRKLRQSTQQKHESCALIRCRLCSFLCISTLAFLKRLEGNEELVSLLFGVSF